MLVAGIGSLLTRSHLTTALNAASDVMNAYKANDAAAANAAYQTWQTSTANALKLYQFESEQYDKILAAAAVEGRTNAESDRAFGAQVLAWSKAVKDPAIEQVYLTQGKTGLVDYLKKTRVAVANLADASGDLEQYQSRQQKWAAIQAANPPPTDPKKMSTYTTKMRALGAEIFGPTYEKSGEDPGDIPGPDGYSNNDMLALLQNEQQTGTKPDFGGGKAGEAALHHYNLVKANYLEDQGNAEFSGDINTVVNDIGTYRQPPPSSYAMYKPENIRIMAMVAQKFPGYDSTQYPAKSAAVKAFDTGTQGNTVRSIDTSALHIGTLVPLIKALNNGDSQTANTLANQFSQQFGGAAPTNFDAAKRIVGAEITKAILGGAGALADREELQADFSSANSPAQLMGVVQSLQHLLSGQLVSLQQQFTSSTGLDAADFQVKLLPQTKQMFLSDYGGGGSSGGETGDDDTSPPSDTPPDDTSGQTMPDDNSDEHALNPAPGSTLTYDQNGNLVSQ